MSAQVELLKAIPVLASLNIERSVEFFVSQLGFEAVHLQPGVHGIVVRQGCEVHFWSCGEKHIAENTSCRINVSGIDGLYKTSSSKGIVHTNGQLAEKPWGAREFTILDPDGNAVTFAEFERHP